MSYKIELLRDLPVLFASFEDDTSLGEFMTELSNEAFEIFESLSSPVYYIVDMHNATINFNDILTGVQQSTKGSRPVLLHHNLKQLIVITESKAISTVVKGLNSVTFGNISAVVFDSLESALNYVRANAA
jgi:hypothetical protein